MSHRLSPLALAACLLTVALAALALLPLPAAHARPALDTVPGEATLSLSAGGQMSLPVSAFCINFGEPFPKGVTVSTTRVPDGVFKVLKTAAKDGTGSQNVLQTQIAVWHALEGKWGYKDKDVDMTVAKALDTASISETTQPLLGRGVALDQAVTEGKVQATIVDWKQADAPKALPTDAPYFGSGTLVVKNLTDAKLDVYVPLGLILKAANEAEQDMAIYAVANYDRAPQALPKTGTDEIAWPVWLAALGLMVVLLGLSARRRPNAREV